MQRLIDKYKATTKLEQPGYILTMLNQDKVDPIYTSDGQFTGGYYTTKYLISGVVYEFTFDPDNDIESAVRYPEEFL
jgi:hypothetical protein